MRCASTRLDSLSVRDSTPPGSLTFTRRSASIFSLVKTFYSLESVADVTLSKRKCGITRSNR
ncbi:hypothetical protein PROFUN_01136 [Planoprotostelium fungivorum]|uniref:Uncharacterized protein n=1 Tax=Planoprotostelium fungivorum TaxID=1890364 RepID=A0A2P6NCF3_9EUKA|nr:hypothetical protein PROFUN_01136 [Planoprotostelium fungivorum]